MRLIKIAAGALSRGHSPAPRRLAFFSAALTLLTGVAALGVTASPALASLPVPTSNVQIQVSAASNNCLDLDAGHVYNYGPIQQYGCNNQDTYQHWNIVDLGNGTYQLQNIAQPGMCVDADAQQPNNNGSIIQWTCNSGDPYQQWVVTVQSVPRKTYLNFQNVGTGFCLDANAGQWGGAGSIIQWSCNLGDSWQLWVAHT